MTADYLVGLVIIAALAAVAWRARAIDGAGAVSGFLLGAGIWWGLGAAGFAVLAVFVVGGSVLTRIGYRVKAARGAAQARQGRRGAANVWANGAVALACAIGSTLFDPLAWAFVGALAAAFIDTSETESGTLVGGKTISLRTFATVPPGTEGAVSLAGTIGGFTAGVLIVAVAAAGGVVPVTALVLLPFTSTLATLIESVVGSNATVDNHLLNVICTLTGASFGLAAAALAA